MPSKATQESFERAAYYLKYWFDSMDLKGRVKLQITLRDPAEADRILSMIKYKDSLDWGRLVMPWKEFEFAGIKFSIGDELNEQKDRNDADRKAYKLATRYPEIVEAMEDLIEMANDAMQREGGEGYWAVDKARKILTEILKAEK